MRVFVTGASGYLGSAIASRLVKTGAEVQGLARTADRAEKLRGIGVVPVLGTLEQFIRSRQADTDVCQWAESCLLAEIEAALPGDAPAAAALLGVTEPTMKRRKAEPRHF